MARCERCWHEGNKRCHFVAYSVSRLHHNEPYETLQQTKVCNGVAIELELKLLSRENLLTTPASHHH